jgi:hypothetical protein
LEGVTEREGVELTEEQKPIKFVISMTFNANQPKPPTVVHAWHYYSNEKVCVEAMSGADDHTTDVHTSAVLS